MKKKAGKGLSKVSKRAPKPARKAAKTSARKKPVQRTTAAKGASVKKPVRKGTGTKKSAPRGTGRVPSAAAPSFDKLLETGGTLTEDLRSVRFAGVSLGGGKTDKTAVAVIEFYPDKRRIFLRSLRDRISVQGESSADENLLKVLNEEETDLSSIAFDVPLQLPECLRPGVECPGMDNCKSPGLKWMKEMHEKRAKDKRPNKMFTPYTERPVEIYISHELEEPFHPPHALGSNAAPLTARAHYLCRQIKTPVMEAYPKLSLWRIGNALGIQKSHLRFHRHAVDSDEARLYILKTLIEKEIAFIYQQDLKVLVENSTAFDAFICALTAFLKHRGQTEKPPSDFPEGESWIEFPLVKIRWF